MPIYDGELNDRMGKIKLGSGVRPEAEGTYAVRVGPGLELLDADDKIYATADDPRTGIAPDDLPRKLQVRAPEQKGSTHVTLEWTPDEEFSPAYSDGVNLSVTELTLGQVRAWAPGSPDEMSVSGPDGDGRVFVGLPPEKQR